MGNIVFLTESAKEQMVNMLNEHNKSAIRLALKGGGCAGFKYDWSLEDETKSDDEVIELPKGKFLIEDSDKRKFYCLTVDYKKEVFGSYFDIKNPTSTSSCGCGESVGF